MPGRCERRNHPVERPHIVRKPVKEDDGEAARTPVIFVANMERRRIDEASRPGRPLRTGRTDGCGDQRGRRRAFQEIPARSPLHGPEG